MSIQRDSILLAAALALVAASAATAERGEKAVMRGIPGLEARLTIIKDNAGVPHIRAQSEADAWFGLGFVHAQDRLWQLEYLRRLGRGRLAEVVGSAALQGDKLFRTLGVVQSAAETWARYPAEHRGLIRSYVAGLNAATNAQRIRELPPEFGILGFEPESWEPEDVLVLAKVLGWSVDRNWTQETLRLQMVQKLGVERTAFLMPAYTSTGPVIVPDAAAAAARYRTPRPREMHAVDSSFLARLHEFDLDVAEKHGFGGSGIGSNNQVLAATRTTTGKPILAADPHLPSQIPSIFYVAHVTGGPLDAIGATVAGLPGVVMGHNGHVAWGWTNANVDVQDLFIERINDNNQAEYNGILEPLQTRQETIKVKGGPDVALTVRSTRHGPLVSDLINPAGPALALRWAALDADDDIGISAYFAAGRARNWQEFSSAFRRYTSHGQNLLYADAEGTIAYLLAGSIPRRAAGDGTLPVPGWTSTHEWEGYIPFDELPRSVNPDIGVLASANNRIAPGSYPYVLGSGYAAPYRAQRVNELLSARARFSPGDLEQVQGDVLALHARELVPLLLRTQPAGERNRRALELLLQWDYRMTQDSAAAAIFAAWYIQLAETLFADELGEALWRQYSDQLHMVSMAMAEAVQTESAWCDDVRTDVREDCASATLTALTAALERMSEEQKTSDIALWRWGTAHRILFFHQPFDSDPGLAVRFSRVFPAAGDKHTVNVASNPRWTDYNQRHLALYRQIIDLSDFANSRWMAAPGQSGVPSDVHYDDLAREWTSVTYRPLLFSRKAIEENAAERYILRP